MVSDELADHCASAITNYVRDHRNGIDGTVLRFTPSIVVGRRYLGVTVDGVTFAVEVNVTRTDEYEES